MFSAHCVTLLHYAYVSDWHVRCVHLLLSTTRINNGNLFPLGRVHADKSGVPAFRHTLFNFLLLCADFKHNMEFTWLGFLLLAVLVPGGAGQSNEPQCGRVLVGSSQRIVGGVTAAEGAWPWQGSLHRNNFPTCGASLINNQWVLCAAHCFPNLITSNLLVYLGRQTQQGTNGNEQVRRVTQLIPHEDYNADTFNNDIALLRLDSPVEFTDYIQPVCLAAQGSTVATGTEVTVTGWGTIGTDEPLPAPQALQEVTVPIVSNGDCNDVYGVITNNMICAGTDAGGQDSCQGDSGGPLVSLSEAGVNTTRYVQVGVVSFGRGCALPEIPGVYARVSQYQSWITSRVTSGPAPIFVNFVSAEEPTGGAGLVYLSAPLLLTLLPTIFSTLVLM
ncbi:trypsin-1-like [Festucalex cinctus]